MIIHHFRLNCSVYSMVFSQIRFGARHPTLLFPQLQNKGGQLFRATDLAKKLQNIGVVLLLEYTRCVPKVAFLKTVFVNIFLGI